MALTLYILAKHFNKQSNLEWVVFIGKVLVLPFYFFLDQIVYLKFDVCQELDVYHIFNLRPLIKAHQHMDSSHRLLEKAIKVIINFFFRGNYCSLIFGISVKCKQNKKIHDGDKANSINFCSIMVFVKNENG